MTQGVTLNWHTPNPEHYLANAAWRMLSEKGIKSPSEYSLAESLRLLQEIGGFERALQHVIFCLSLPPGYVKLGVGGFIRGGIAHASGQLMTWSLMEWRDIHESSKDRPKPFSKLISRHLSEDVAAVVFPGLEKKKK